VVEISDFEGCRPLPEPVLTEGWPEPERALALA
jgi:hypothetical protein